MPRHFPKAPWPVTCWVFFCTFLNCSGWLLSAFNQLNATAYALVLGVSAAGALLLWNRGWIDRPMFDFRRQKRRVFRFFPAAFAVLAAMAFLGGLIHPPTNYDALAYRLPRVLHWLAEGRWHWIHTQFHRLNTRSCGYEWIAAPILALTGSDRPLFLIDFICFLLLPGLFFSVLTRLGVRGRVAWHWMWVLPTGYCYLLQAGSIGNDILGATFGLIALDMALRARVSRQYSDLCLAILAVALLTGSKASNIPLALPWLVAVLPALPLLFRRPICSTTLCAVAALTSFLPMAALNYENCGDWTGWAAERTTICRGDYANQVSHNCLVLLVQNLSPPIFPFAEQWDHAMKRFISPATQARLALSFEPDEALLALPQMQTEEAAGLGFGVTALLLISLAATFWQRKPQRNGLVGVPRTPRWIKAVVVGPWLSMLPFLAKLSWSSGRLTTPYYGLLVPLLLLGAAQDSIVRQAWWRRTAALVFVLAAVLVIVSPARPLCPARAIVTELTVHHPTHLLERAQTVYSVYADRSNAFAPLCDCVPADARTVGLVTFDDPEASLWRPFGRGRRIRHVTPADSKADLQAEDIKYVLVSEVKFPVVFSESFEHWLTRIDGKIIRTVPLRLRADSGFVNWFIVELRREETKQALH